MSLEKKKEKKKRGCEDKTWVTLDPNIVLYRIQDKFER